MSILDVDSVVEAVSIEVIMQYLKNNYVCSDGDGHNKSILDVIEIDNSGYIPVVSAKGHSVTLFDSALSISNGFFRWGEVEDFYCSYNENIVDLTGSPRKAKVFCCRHCTHLISLEGAPDEVITFDCTGCHRLESLEYIPVVYDSVVCGGTAIQNFKPIQPGCTRVSATWCNNLNSIKDLPDTVENIMVGQCHSLESLETNAVNCKFINADQTGITNLNNLPKKLRRLSLNLCGALEDFSGLKDVIDNLDYIKAFGVLNAQHKIQEILDNSNNASIQINTARNALDN